MSISFCFESINFTLPQKSFIKSWLRQLAEAEGKRVGDITFIFCSDDYLLSVNRKYLSHDYYTDVITFDYADGDNLLFGDIFISIDTIFANAQVYNVAPTDELHRVMAHGILHLCGYPDATDEEQAKMHALEDRYLDIFHHLVPDIIPILPPVPVAS